MGWDDGDKGNPWQKPGDKGPADLDAIVRPKRPLKTDPVSEDADRLASEVDVGVPAANPRGRYGFSHGRAGPELHPEHGLSLRQRVDDLNPQCFHSAGPLYG